MLSLNHLERDNPNEPHQEEDLSVVDGLPNYPKISLQLDSPKEWSYTMRRSMQKVIRGLYLGPYSAATKSKLQSLLDKDKFTYLVLNIADSVTENIIQHFTKVKHFIDDALKQKGKVLVHGNAGISRSAALVLAYMMETYGLTQKRAYTILQQRRFCINPNDGFMAQLREFEPIYQAQKALRDEQERVINQGNKRTLQMLDTENGLEDKHDAMDS